jgi:hypothetical protein
MIQLELDLEKSQLDFLKQYNVYGFKNESELIKKALDYFHQQLNTVHLINGKLGSENEDNDNDPFINGLFSGSSDLATR